MARPTKFNKEIADEIVGYVATGASLETSATAAGICDATLRTWRKKYPAFLRECQRARARSIVAEAANHSRIRRGRLSKDNLIGDAKASQWWLARMELSFREGHTDRLPEGIGMPTELRTAEECDQAQVALSRALLSGKITPDQHDRYLAAVESRIKSLNGGELPGEEGEADERWL